MPAVSVARASRLSPDLLWGAVTDLEGHTPFVPLTTLRGEPGGPRLGWEVVARTAAGPLRVDDRMLVVTWQPPPTWPARARLVKTGRLLDGWADIEVTPDGDGSRVVWSEEVLPRPWLLRRLTKGAGRLPEAATRRLLTRILDGVIARAEQEAYR